MTFKIDRNQVQITNQILTNKHVRFQFVNNKLIILSNPSNIDIERVLELKFIVFKQI